MVKKCIAGIQVPEVATSSQLRSFVHKVFVAHNKNHSHAADAIGVSPATIWKLESGEQKDSQVVRDALGIRRTRLRPRVWMPTNNVDAAVIKLIEHYTPREIAESFLRVKSAEDIAIIIDVVKYRQEAYEIWHGTGEEGGFEGFGDLIHD
jgi:hypothetical protein